MIMYNTLIGVCAGLAILISADALRILHTGVPSAVPVPSTADGPAATAVPGGPVPLLGHAAGLAVTGAPLAVLATAMTLTWPLTVKPPINIAFGEPSMLLASLALVGAWALARGKVELRQAVTIRPVQWTVVALGVILAFTSSAVLSYNVVGDAPPEEPITGQFTGWENPTWGIAYAVAAVGCIAVAFYRPGSKWAYRVVFWCWIISGLFFLAFALLNYRTHIGMLVNLERGTNYRW